MLKSSRIDVAGHRGLVGSAIVRRLHELEFFKLIRKFDEAKCQEASTVTVWGTGTPRRDFLHMDDMADARLSRLGWTSSRTLQDGIRSTYDWFLSAIADQENTHIRLNESHPPFVTNAK